VGRHRTVEGVGLTEPGPATGPKWQRGDVVVVRQHRRGRFRAVTPMIVVDDGSDRTVLFVPQHTTFLAPADQSGRVTRRIAEEAGLTLDRWRDRGGLHIVPAGAAFSVMARWETSFDDFSGYYVNLQEPLRRTGIGFDTMDQTLDVVVSADLSGWAYKDEDELTDAAAHGFYSGKEVAAIRSAARLAVELVTGRRAPFDEPWQDWRPDPAWPLPSMPCRWREEPVSPSPWAA